MQTVSIGTGYGAVIFRADQIFGVSVGKTVIAAVVVTVGRFAVIGKSAGTEDIISLHIVGGVDTVTDQDFVGGTLDFSGFDRRHIATVCAGTGGWSGIGTVEYSAPAGTDPDVVVTVGGILPAVVTGSGLKIGDGSAAAGGVRIGIISHIHCRGAEIEFGRIQEFVTHQCQIPGH